MSSNTNVVPSTSATPTLASPNSVAGGRRDLDVVVFGATGFTGSLAAQYLVDYYGPTGSQPLRVGLAGRSLRKLIRLRDNLEARVADKNKKGGGETAATSSPGVCSKSPTNHSTPPAGLVKKWGDSGVMTTADAPLLAKMSLIEADVNDQSSLVRMTARCDALVSFVGPYYKYGEAVVRACVETATNYADVSAELDWVRMLQLRYGTAAAGRGIKLVHFCGMSCLPLDVASAMVQRRALERYGTSCHDIRARSFQFKGGLSLTSVSVALRMVGELTDRVVKDPFFFCRQEEGRCCSGVANGSPNELALQTSSGILGVEYESDMGFTYPDVGEFISRKVVNWSHMVMHHVSSTTWQLPRAGTFRYTQRLAPRLHWAPALLVAMLLITVVRPMVAAVRLLLRSSVIQQFMQYCFTERLAGLGWLPANGSLRAQVIGTTEKDVTGDTHSIVCNVEIDGEPNYAETAGMAVECALCMALEPDACPPTAGVLTPAAAVADTVVKRLNHVGRVRFSFA